MSSEFEKNLEKYAEVLVKVALNLQPGQKLFVYGPFTIGVPLELAPLVRLVAEKAYKCGATHVEVKWYDENLRLTRFQHAPLDSFTEFPIWIYDYIQQFIKEGNALLSFIAWNPDLLSEQDPEKIKLFQQTYFKGIEQVSKLMQSYPTNLSYVAGPVEGWAKKVFPNLPQESRINKLWDMIFEMCRVKEKDPISAWREHINQLKKRQDYLNKKKYQTLQFNAPGTNLTIGLPKDHRWVSGNITTKSGIEHAVNVPTEEIFTTPHKNKTEGFVKATKPLYFAEGLMEDFKLTFSEGKIIEATARKGEEFLQNLINMDEGAHRLGEVALVPQSSPISKMDMLFYNGLIDENASSHIAFGKGLRLGLKDGVKMSDEEFAEAGGNYSKVHVDFMIGSEKMDVDGIMEDGTVEPIMRNGEWAFEV
ncbi:MAG: aminopeptidase [Candidatus Hodarchaeota archaeon]